MNVTATFVANDIKCCPQQIWCKFVKVVSMMRMNDDIERPGLIATGDLAVANGMRVDSVASDDSCKPFTPAFTQIEPQVVVQRSSTIGAPRIGDEGADLFHAFRIHMSFDFQ
jgi:hypothetical protein